MHRPLPGRRLKGRGHPNTPSAVAPAQSTDSGGFPCFPPFYSQPFYSLPYWNFPPAASPLAHGIPQLHPFPYVQSTQVWGPQVVNSPGKGPEDLCGRVEAALEKAHSDLLAAGDSVSGWKVSQAALISLQADSWASLGFQFQDIPFLRRLVAAEGKVNAFIHCFVGVWKIASVHDLDVAICKNEGIEQFDALGLGPLLRHPLVSHYFSIPPDAAEVPKITAEEIVSCLSFYVDNVKKMVVPDEFLTFLMAKYGVSSKEKLGVRIQSIGLHLAFIRDAKKAEHFALKKCLDNTSNKKGETEGRPASQPPNMFSEKPVLDRRFGYISRRMKSFSSACDGFEGKHIKFDSSGEDDSQSDSKSYGQGSPRSNSDLQQRVSSCPYPSTTEEIKRLGLQPEVDEKTSSSIKTHDYENKRFSGRKRKHGDQSYKMKMEKRFSFDRGTMQEFIKKWKKTCRNCSVLEVLNRMQDFYSFQNKLRKKGSKRAFSSYPGIGLLNVAVAAIKSGMLDSIYDAFDDVEQGLNCGTPALDGDIASELLAEKDDISMKKMCTSRHESRVTDDAVLKKIACYFEADCPQTSGDRLLEKKIAILRQFRDCEVWLEREFSVDAFCSLGYGHLVDFLERNLDRLPVEVCRRFEDSSKFRLEVNHHQLETFLSQACKTVVDVGVVSQPYISMLLEKQFPILCFDFVGHEADSNFQDLFEKKGSDPPNRVYYSATLLGKFFLERLPNVCCGRYSPVAVGNGIKVDDNTDHSDNVSPKDAVECLLKVPMLSDLISWTHWDIVFAPKFGPLLAWLSEEARSEELSCIATSDGRLIRIDHSSTVDEFLDAMICCSPFRAALKLLSLLALYGGTSNIPITLLKCYSQRAMDAIFRSCMECLDIDPVFQFPNETEIQRSDSNNSQLFADTSRSTLYTGSNIAASFVLDCLEHIPTEFRSFAAEILMSGLRSSVKDASRIMLNECKRTEQRIMLHAIGFSLGIVEWIEDYNLFKLETWTDSVPSFQGYCQILKSVSPSADKDKKNAFAASVTKVLPSNQSSIVDSGINTAYSDLQVIECTADRSVDDNDAIKSEDKMFQDASDVIESIRREEFGLYASSSFSDSTLLKKQHARLGRALHCLSQELYSQDSHLLLELVQNADDNTYSGTVEPTLVFILQADAIVILNNERGFSAENIRALCDIGNSTKKGSSAGYIGHKGIGFKSVFRVTDAPEIHSNGFHVKFDISEGPIGFVLPTVIPAHDIRPFERQLSSEIDRDIIPPSWSTCIVLPLRPKLKERSGMSSIVTMFSDLHPSLLLFLHRLECMKFMNALDGSLIVMKKETLGDGMVRVSYGNEKMDWLVVRQKLQPTVLRPGVQMTEIALAFTLQETETGEYTPYLNQQPAFAFLPLRTYGLKFILQADFVLPSSREEIDGNSAWNQWLLSEFPVLFVNAEACFTALPCYKKCPGKAVSAYMSFVPNIGEVHGFFSNLPQMIVSKLRVSRCLLLEGHEMEWVLPCKALKGWDERARKLISDSLLQRHLGLGFLDRNITLSNSLVKTLGVRDYGPKILTDILSSICRDRREIKELGFEWLSDCLVALSIMLSHNSYDGMETDVISHLRRIPFIPLADGSYGSTAEGPIWLPGESENIIHDYHFPRLYAKLCTVDPVFLSLNRDIEEKEEGSRRDIVVRLLEKFGVQQLSAHEVIMSHILPAVSAARYSAEDKNLMVEYLSYVMLHFQNVCSNCQIQRKRIVLDLQKSASILTNHGYKCSAEVPLHFSQAFGNPFEIDKLIDPKDDEWNAVDEIYLQHYSVGSSASLLAKWRKFLQELGVSDFVQVLRVEKKLKDDVSGESQIIAWESPELSRLLSTFSSGKHKEKCRYLLEVLDKKWDELSSEAENYAREASVDGRPQRPPFLKCIHDFRWIGSTADEELHYPKDVFCDCEEVRCMLGSFAPYAIPQVKSKKLLEELGFKTQVSCEDALEVLELCGARCSGTQVSASTMQMSKLYNFIWEAVTTERLSMRRDQLRSLPLKIFVPCSSNSTWSETVQAGAFLSPNHVYWRDPTGCLDVIPGRKYKTLFKLYPSLQDFFVGECGVLQTPSFGDYVDILLELSKVTLPAQAAHLVFRVFVKWAGLVEGEEIARLRESLRKAENTVLPTKQGRWVSLHPSSGIVCRSDDIGLEEQFMDSRNLHFIHFGELSGDDSEILSGKVSPLLKKLGVVAFSEIVSREAIFYGTEDCREKASLICWALPYAQRYVLQSRPDEFAALKKLASERLPLLRTVCVDKLFYRYIIKISEGASRKRYECSCLLQDNVFYVTRTSDSHSIFLELSRLFFNGAPELQFANFLHMIRIMAESGSAEEQIEFFIVNSQKVPALPAEEPVWSLSPASSSSQAPRARKTCPPSLVSMPQTAPSFWRTTGISANWPPTDWKTAPDFTGARHFGASGTAVEEIFEVDGDWMAAVEESSSAAPVDAPGRFRPEPEAGAADPGDSEDVPLCLGGLGLADSQQQHRTGFIGEAVAFKYLRDKCSGSGSVKWVNEEGETGLPYDLIVEDEGGRKEYVEVKATRVATKYWFPITAREWQFAAEAGEAYSIAHVSLAGGKTARVTLLKNPLRLCQQNALNLALFMRKQ